MSDKQQKWLQEMQELLAHNVPRFIKHIRDRGGVSDEEARWLNSAEYTNPDCLQGMLAQADRYLLQPKKQKNFQKGLFVLTLALAIASFDPGGVSLFGLHFEERSL